MFEMNAGLSATWVDFAIQIIISICINVYILFKSMQPCAVTAVDGQNSQRNVRHVTVITGASGATGIWVPNHRWGGFFFNIY